jgi:hypothetical protein
LRRCLPDTMPNARRRSARVTTRAIIRSAHQRAAESMGVWQGRAPLRS